MKLIVLDRDGVINVDSDDYVRSAEQWQPLPGSLAAIARLNRAGWQVAVATNQSGLARGYFTTDDLAAMHEKLQRLLAEEGGRVDLILHCPHGPEVACDCRKPLPGLFRAIADHYGRNELTGVPVVGDSLRDLEAGVALGCTPYLVRTGKGERTLAKPLPSGTRVFADLAAVADHLLEEAP
ncbi:D,D-heptose 1,7-bisphosphate phosphatase [Pseudomonas oryzihabitans]|uniref:D-glycero-beta-D-manno-heptose 1,7-bisphosphate 7-phosphatase n=1 Tax=Pseudomonas rhizoryzae TaxID=2571129 RepID=UPI0007375399|nr:D-glycero-beta-D-manno-heptose 1,7-bisphosphate 7-phosphatase [Pseudomonas rhizoryzae]KTT31454.1 D,D-heptose 1,7-bisphosphate phosphatase [Pseudomonas psychrotolerans]KTT40344.1 D,D-heptose 1,7-bisphosphate phosphatase [Pseudomonas psychrotolerans]KTT45110.1 D,D-heptose 1,7-bisphosphate phosphatase [Pseudomonas psychrotolerans]KTT67136.1 D,D-heptose 1,7-bisphosphate phosphatase [Pseudomonas psychrotolerans]KTT74505.1 D,D-heptose 1,7-bisphosphate phosphatase [Pseudomonas psychrotolerans]